MVEPSIDCKLLLRHIFNDSGVYCINVSMANDVSLAVTSARVNIDIGIRNLPTMQQSSALLLYPGLLTV